MDDYFESIPLTQLLTPWVVLRPVRKDRVDYLMMRDSIRSVGFLNSISVRPSVRQPGKYEIIDGNYRYHCAVELNIESIHCIVKHGVSDDDVLALQIQANAIRPTTTPIEFSRQLKAIVDTKPGMTFSELASIVHKSSEWVKDRLGLLYLPADVQLMVDRGEIPVGNAYMLTRIPPILRADYVEQAMCLPVKDFKPLAAGVIKRFKEGVQQGKLDKRYVQKQEPTPHLRSLKVIKQELECSAEGALVIATENCKSLMDVWFAALRWATNQDRRSIEQFEYSQSHRANRKLRKPRIEGENDLSQ